MATSLRAGMLQGDDVLQTYELNRALRRGEKSSAREDFAKALLKQGTDTSPVPSHLTGLARALTAGLGGYHLGQAQRESRDEERMMLADMLGKRSQQQAEEQRQLASAGVPGFSMPMPQIAPGVARPQPTAAPDGAVVEPVGMIAPPPTPAPAPVDANLIQALSAMAASGNRTAAGAMPGVQFQYADAEAKRREQRAEELALAREARADARANRETFGAPVELQGPNGPVLAQIGNRGTVRPLAGYQTPDAVPKPTTPLEIERLLAARGIQPGTPEYQEVLRQYTDLKINPKPSTTVNVGGTEKAFDKEIGTQTAKQLVQFRDDALTAEKAVESGRRITKLLDEGAITGMGADWRTAANRALYAAGLVDGQRVKNTEALVGELARGVLAAAGDMKGALSDKDVNFLKEVAQGSIALTEATLRRAATLAEKGNTRLIQRYNEAAGAVAGDPGMPPTTRSMFAPLAIPGAGQPALPPPPASSPQAGAVENGYRFRGGDPANPTSWERVQ